MRPLARCTAMCLSAAMAVLAGHGPVWGEEPASRSYATARLSSAAFVTGMEMRDRVRGAEREILQALQAEVSFDFRREPLQKALEQLTGSIPLSIHEVALTEEGVALHAFVNGRLRNVTVDTALRRILEPLGLTFIVEHEALFVTTETEASEWLRLKTFDVGPLLDQGRRLNRRLSARDRRMLSGFMDSEWPGDRVSDNEWLEIVLLDCTSGEWEEVDGIGGTVMIVGDKLLVRQTYAVLEEVRGMLEALEEAAAGRLRYGSAIIQPAGYPRRADERIFETLARRVSGRYTGRPLGEVLDDLGDRMGIPIWIDRVAWSEEGLSPDEPVSIDRQNVALHSLLTLLLYDFGLTWYVDRGTLVATTETEAAEILRGALFDFRDLYAAGIDGATLIGAVQEFTSGEWEELDGVGGTVEMPFAGILLVRQTGRVLVEIDGLLADLRYRNPATSPLPAPDSAPRTRGSSAAASSASSRSSSTAGRIAGRRPDPPLYWRAEIPPADDESAPAIGAGFFSTKP